MFTGLIEQLGKVREKRVHGAASRLWIDAPPLARLLSVGDSVAVNGVCLTATQIDADGFAADVSQETVSRTTLARLLPGTSVNLELPARADESLLGGHIVQGHVDGCGTVAALVPLDDQHWSLTVEIPPPLTAYVVEKGSIAIDGISLTVAQITGSQVTAAIIPHTYQATNLSRLRPGDAVNIEVDVLAKYAEKLQAGKRAVSRLTLAQLRRQGF